ncbi:hypothetical protein CGLAU_06590 [Corynebacterium glaucum]|uniref:Cardiolipin synthase N-terminal domain-containing protein n=1 Tax=Corynebacterium glaucum TaxID=187491 RepID=A0A1Q2HWY0_9CORY|nr:PLD nuclease N-terminal domain-containing protein [Corynebacterium glaucum]AQQ15280.1 hypothetical protein CGLAU_06590 [Corynebacterium glaucum]
MEKNPLAELADHLLAALREGWNSLSRGQRRALGAVLVVDSTAKAIALADLARANKRRVRGPKWAWAPLITFVDILGWVSYFAAGKKR